MSIGRNIMAFIYLLGFGFICFIKGERENRIF